MLPHSRCCDYICETRGSSIRTAKSPFIRPQCEGAQHGMIALSPINDPGRYVVAGMPYPDLRPAGHDFQGKDVMRRFLPATYLGTRGRSAIAQSSPLEGGDIASRDAMSAAGPLVPADALPARAKDTPATPNIGTAFLARFRFEVCFVCDIVEFLRANIPKYFGRGK